MEVLGKIKVLSDVINVTDSFKKRELVVVTDEQFPQSIMIEFPQDKADLLNAFKVGQDVKVSINLGGREWVNPQGETKYFNSIKGWRIEALGKESKSKQEPKPTFEPAFTPATNVKEEEHDDLPF